MSVKHIKNDNKTDRGRDRGIEGRGWMDGWMGSEVERWERNLDRREGKGGRRGDGECAV